MSLEERLGLPDWVSLIGLLEHCIVGGILTAVLGLLKTPPGAVVVSALVLILMHEREQRDVRGRYFSDFRSGNPGAPLNGACDVLAVLPFPLLYAFVWLLNTPPAALQ